MSPLTAPAKVLAKRRRSAPTASLSSFEAAVATKERSRLMVAILKWGKKHGVPETCICLVDHLQGVK